MSEFRWAGEEDRTAIRLQRQMYHSLRAEAARVAVVVLVVLGGSVAVVFGLGGPAPVVEAWPPRIGALETLAATLAGFVACLVVESLLNAGRVFVRDVADAPGEAVGLAALRRRRRDNETTLGECADLVGSLYAKLKLGATPAVVSAAVALARSGWLSLAGLPAGGVAVLEGAGVLAGLLVVAYGAATTVRSGRTTALGPLSGVGTLAVAVVTAAVLAVAAGATTPPG